MGGCDSPIASPTVNTPPAVHASLAGNMPPTVNASLTGNMPPAVNSLFAGNTPPTINSPLAHNASPTGHDVATTPVERTPDPFAAVFQFENEDRKPIGNLFRVRRRVESERPLYENGNAQLPPLVPSSPEDRLLARSRLWGLWTDSVRLQRRLETLESAAECCVEQYSSTGWF